MSFSSKINALALPRREPRVMKGMVPDEGRVFVFADLISAEAVCQASYSGDKILAFQSFDGIGKLPQYNDKELLMISDPYIALASVSPVGEDIIREAYYDRTFGGMTFSEAWITNPDLIKDDKRVGAARKFNKAAWLGFSYGLKGDTSNPTDRKHGFRNNALKNGYTISSKQAWGCYEAFWSMYPDVTKSKKNMEKRAKAGEVLFNPFGFRLNTQPRNVWNALLQSSVAGILSYTEYLIDQRKHDYEFIARIHDELGYSIPVGAFEDFCAMLKEVENEINGILEWDYPVRFDPKMGNNLYDIK